MPAVDMEQLDKKVVTKLREDLDLLNYFYACDLCIC